MEKVWFSPEQKSLIWKRFVQPDGGTEEEAKHFIEVCEMFGLNPLLRDIVFQKYETHGFFTKSGISLGGGTSQPFRIGSKIERFKNKGNRSLDSS